MARKSGAVWKRCQECNAVNRASAFKKAPKTNIGATGRVVVCASCGYQAPSWAFPAVERPAEQGEERSQ